MFLLGVLTLVAVWLGPLPELAPRLFSAHMTMHMAVVAVAAPLLAFGLAGGPLDPARRFPAVFAAVPASILELVVVWFWHTPALHHAARGSSTGLLLEQSSFLAAGFLVWMSAVGGMPAYGAPRAGSGVVALLLTSMHMTLLGALIALAPRVLYAHAVALQPPAAALAEQHLGGVIMLVVGGASYLFGGLWLAARMLRAAHGAAAAPRQETT
jgi:putative membrane protein